MWWLLSQNNSGFRVGFLSLSDFGLYTFVFADESSVLAKRNTGHQSQSIEFDFGLYRFMFPDESSVVANRSTGHRKLVYWVLN